MLICLGLEDIAHSRTELPELGPCVGVYGGIGPAAR